MTHWIALAASTDILRNWADVQGDLIGKGTALLLLACAAAWLLRGASASMRHLVWFSALAACLVLPVLTLMLPRWEVLPPCLEIRMDSTTATSAAPVMDLAAAKPLSAGAATADVDQSAIVDSSDSQEPHMRRSAVSDNLTVETMPEFRPTPASGIGQSAELGWVFIFFVLWSTGVVMALTRIALAYASLFLVARRSERIVCGPLAATLSELRNKLDIRSSVVLLKGPVAAMPMTWGLRPHVLLPAQAEHWSNERCRLVLLHELAHIKRRDHLTHLVAQVARAVAWYNPLTWLAVARLDLEREQACDDWVLRCSGSKSSNYAQHLLEIRNMLVPNWTVQALSIAMARRSGLESRTLAILDSTRNRRAMKPASAVGAWCGIAFVVGALAAVHTPAVTLAQNATTVPPAENLLPKTTKAFVSAASIKDLETAWNKTQLGQLMQDPAMKPFMDSLQEQLQKEWTKTHHKLGITWDDLKDVPSGEAAMGIIQSGEKEMTTAIVADVTGRHEQARALFQKVDKDLAAQKAVRSQRAVRGTQVTVLDVPKQGEQQAYQVSYALLGDLLATADHVQVLEGILGRAAQAKGDNLGTVPAFDASMKRCSKGAGTLTPHARWFIDPFGYIDLTRAADTSTKPKPKKTDMVKILKHQGFSAIEGIGAYLNFSTDSYEALQRAYIHAPGTPPARFTLAARMLDLPNGGAFDPPDWVPADVSRYLAFNLKVANAFESSKTLIDEYIGDEGAFEEILTGIRDDKDGPRVDIRKEVIAHLGTRITIISDVQLPITPKSERILIGIEATDAKKLAAAVEKWMLADPDIRRREINGHIVWERIEDQDAPKAAPGEEKPVAPNAAFTVAFGQLFAASHIEILAKALSRDPKRGKLADSADFKRVTAQTTKLALLQQSMQMFARTDVAYQEPYELWRLGRLPESESLLGIGLNSLLGDGKKESVRQQRFDASKLPDYDLARRALGPGGLTMTTEGQGWYITSFLMSKE